MALSDTIQTQRLVKGQIFYVARTSDKKAAGAETESSIPTTAAHEVWADSNNIITNNPTLTGTTTNTTEMEIYQYVSTASEGTSNGDVYGLLELEEDPTSTENAGHKSSFICKSGTTTCLLYTSDAADE